MNDIQHTMASNVGACVSVTSFLGFWSVAEPYTKVALAVLTLIAIATTILVNVKKLRS